MGGKDKQRTKGNLKPSSSGRAAALISKDGTVGFVGFGGLQGTPGASNLGYVPMAAGVSEDVDACVDPEFRMVMRKLMKRDAVTKLKAVQEFTDLCKNSTVQAVESALPFWPRLFNKLAMDVDHRVREATQQAMEQLVLRVGRNLAPHLRYVIGPWLCAQFDTYAVVASSGRKSFQAAFSEEKQAGVIKFCRKELFEFLQDNILTQTSSTLSDPKFVSEEEREAKYNRVLSSSILVLGHLVHVTSSDKENADMEELYLNVLRQNKFWKYARHKSPNVRAAVFSTVSIACESLPSMMLSLSSQASPVVLSALDDSDPAVCQQLWNAVLSVLKNITDCWKQVNVRKAVLPKLWSVLKSGGSGCATVIFPNLLPFLSKVPAEVIGSGVGFYKEFFTSQQEGLMKERVQNSPSECSAIIAAFMECLRFCLLRGFDGDGPDVTVQEYLIKEQLLSVLKSSLEKQSKLSQSNLYPLVAELLSYLSSKSENDSKLDEVLEEQKTPQPYHHMLEWFWQGFSSVCLENLQSVVGKVVSDGVINSVSHCLVTLKLPSKNKKKQLKVAFMEPSSEPFDNDSSEIEKRGSSMESFAGSADVENLYNGCILDLVCNACSLCLDEVSQNNSLLHLKLLSRLVPHFTSTKLMKTLLEKTRSEQSSICSEPDNDNYSELSEQFLTHTLFCWIENVPFGGDVGQVSGVFSDRRSLDYLVSIFCGIVRTLPIVKQVDLVSQSLQQNTAVRFVYKVLEEGLHSEVPGVVKWLQSEQGSERLLELSRCLVLHVGQDVALCAEDRKTVWKIIKLCIVTEQHVAKLENELVDRICQHFLRLLRQSPQEHEQELPLLLDILQTYLAHCEKNPGDIVHSIEELLLAVFHLQLTNVVSYSSAAAQSLTETWQTGLRVLKQLPSEMDSTPCQTLLLKTAVLVQEKLQTVQTLKRVDDLATIAVQLLQDAINLSPAEESDGESLSQRVFVALTPSEQQLNLLRNEYSKSQWLLDPLIERKLPVMSDFHDCLDECENVRSTLTNHQKMMVFSSSLLKEILSNSKESTPDLKSEVVTRDCFLRLLLETNWVRHWCICVLGYSDSTEEYIAYSDISDQTVSNLLVKLQQTTQQLLEHVKEKQWSEAVLADALTRSRSEGFLWCVVLGGVLKDLQQLDVPYEAAVLLAEVQSLASLEEKECQTLNTLISHVNGIYELKVITEQYTRLLREENDEGGFARVLAVIDGSLHQWFKRTEGVEEALLEYQLTLTEILDELVEWNKTHDDLVLINSPLHDASMSVLSLNLSLIRILEMAVLHCSDKMNRKHWDFALCCLAGWLQTCEENRIILTTSLKSVALCCQVCSLFCVVVRFFQENASKLSKLSDDGNSSEASHEVESESSVTADNSMFPPNLFAEWQEFFSGSLFSTVLRLFLFYAAQCQSSHFEVSFWSTRIGESIGKAVIYTPTALLKEHKFEGPPPATAEESTNMPQWIGDLLGNCLPLLKSSIHDLQFAGYHLLSKVMAQISLLDDQEPEPEPEPEEGVDEPIRSPPTSLIVLINDACAHMAEMVSEAHVPFGEHLDMTSDTEAQNTSLALMLAWKLMLQFFRSLPQERRVEYAKFIRQNKMVGDLLGVLFRLIPLKATPTATVVVADDFEPDIGRFAGQRTIQQLACGIYYYLSQWMPAIVRQWWNGLDKRQSGIVDKFTISSITPQLCQREMQLVQSSSIRFDNMQVKTRPSAREVAAVYTVDEISMELVVKLAPNHPLGVVSVESGKKIGVTAAQWRSWMLQMTTFLTHQNGSIMDGLILWKRNVDKRFEGVEDCMICFSVIHGSNYSLPKLSCKTCKKKFHSACLYKWFSTSNNATCPLCRNLF